MTHHPAELPASRSEGAPLEMGGFDGGYTYFASPTTSYGADPRNWREMSEEAAARGLMFIPSVGPGYNDTKIRPWNSAATRSREGGRAYARAWRAALKADPAAVTITSYNEWGEGTQIEPAEARLGYVPYRTVSWLPSLLLLRTHRAKVQPDTRIAIGTPTSDTRADFADFVPSTGRVRRRVPLMK